MPLLFNADRVTAAKKKMKNSIDIFAQVEHEGQNAIFVGWVVSEKVKDGVVMVKSRLVARGYEKGTNNICKDSQICSREAVCIALSLTSN